MHGDFSLIQVILTYTEKEIGDIMWKILFARKEHRLTKDKDKERRKKCNMSSIICSFLSVDLLGTTHMLWDVTTTIFRPIWIVVSLND